MKLMRAIFSALLAMTLLCGFASTVFAQEKALVGISTPTADHGWTGGIVWWAEKAIKDFGEKYPDIEFIYCSSDSEKEQAADIEMMLSKNIQALIILPHKPAPLTTVLNRVNKSGAFIIVVDRSIPKVPKDVYLSGDNYGFGLECGLYMSKALGGKGKIVVMEGIPCEGNSLRVNGFKDGIKDAPEIEVMDSQPAYWSPSRGYELMQQYLEQFPQIDAVWCGDDDVLEDVLKAYKESGRSDVKLFLGGGGSKLTVKRIIDGDPLVHATVTYPPNMVYESIGIALQHLTKGTEFPKEIVLPSVLITKDNAMDYYFPESIY